jgi:hypothetical protein
MVKNKLLPHHLISRCLLFIISGTCCLNVAGLLTMAFSFSPFISLSYPYKTTMFIVIGISDLNLFSFDLCIFIIFFFDKILFFFQFNIWFLICIYNIFRFGHSTFNFLFFSFTLLSKFL